MQTSTICVSDIQTVRPPGLKTRQLQIVGWTIPQHTLARRAVIAEDHIAKPAKTLASEHGALSWLDGNNQTFGIECQW